MIPNPKRKVFSSFICMLMLMVACAPENNGWLGKRYHNVTAHYNGYFYANGEINKIEQTLLKGQIDDYNRILKIFPALDSSTAKSYEKESEEAVKMASLAIQRHPHSKWVDDAYILVGKARLYSMDWANAISTFKYVNTKSKDPNARHRALIHLLRTFVEHKEYNNAQAAIDYLQKEKLSKSNLKKFYLEKAYYHQTQNDLDNMVRSLTKIEGLLKKKDRRGRIFFITGQIYQKLGFESEAYNYYKKCLATNPEYEVDFYARLYLAQVAEISKTRDVNTAHKSFKKLLKDGKNKEFKDKIYYEMGIFELKQKDLKEAMGDFNLSIRTGKNKRIDGEAYLRLGEIYYDTLKNFEKSQAYYDSAISSLPKDFEEYEKIKERAKVLDDFVKNLKTIQWQDSLLSMANLDSVSLRKRIDSVLTIKKAEEARNAKKKKRSSLVSIQSNANNNVFANDDGEATEGQNGNESETNNESAGWYFGNQSAMALGQSEFTRIWGAIVLEDNWRRSQRTTKSSPLDVQDQNLNQKPAPENSAAKLDPVDVEYKKLNDEIPRTLNQQQEALSKIEDAYFALGDIYYYKLLEKRNAVSSYKKLLDRFPKSEYAPELLYKIYLINKEIDPSQADPYAKLLKEKYPHSTFAKILINPDYLKQSGEAVEKQKVLYKTAYQQFVNAEYFASLKTIETAEALEETSFIPNLKLLRILIIGKTEDINKYQYELDEFIKNNPDAEVTPYAKKLLETSKQFQQDIEKQKEITYIKSFEESHYFVLVYKKEDKVSNQITSLLENFNNQSFGDLKLKTSSLIFNDEYSLAMVSELPRISYALEYYKTFIDKMPEFAALQNIKISTFVITKDNFDIFYRTKGLDEYVKFFEKNYHPNNQ
jgi:tetratricopeptide (TPR) repeat protein